MTIPLFHVDAFTDRPFGGNPAAVCLLPVVRNRPEGMLQRVALSVMAFAYFGFFETKPEGQTLGKKAMKIKVVDINTGQPILGRGWTRAGGRILSSIVCALGYLWILWDKDKQTWHDKFATSTVVKAA